MVKRYYPDTDAITGEPFLADEEGATWPCDWVKHLDYATLEAALGKALDGWNEATASLTVRGRANHRARIDELRKLLT